MCKPLTEIITHADSVFKSFVPAADTNRSDWLPNPKGIQTNWPCWVRVHGTPVWDVPMLSREDERHKAEHLQACPKEKPARHWVSLAWDRINHHAHISGVEDSQPFTHTIAAALWTGTRALCLQTTIFCLSVYSKSNFCLRKYIYISTKIVF